ncbi:hypothetical protein EZS27_019715, partial [termite gut metagenome]
MPKQSPLLCFIMEYTFFVWQKKKSFRVIFRVGYLESSKTFIIFVLSKLPTIWVSIHFVTHLLPNKGEIYDKSIIINLLHIQISLLGQLVVARLCQPQSRMATVDYLKSHFDEDVDLHKIYLYLDKLYATERDKV